MPEAAWGDANRWLTVMQIDPNSAVCDRETIRLALEAENIESRPVWKPMHLQPIFNHYDSFGGSVSEKLFRDGLCLPSGSSLSRQEQDRVIDIILSQLKREI